MHQIHIERWLLTLSFSFCLATLLCSQDLPHAAPEDVGMSAERLTRLTENFRKYSDADQLSGGVIMVLREGKVVYHEAFGDADIDENKVMKKDAIFRIASQTKALVSVGIMMLQEEGKLLISDPLHQYIAEFKDSKVAVANEDGYEVVPADRAITLRDLLTHTAGIGYGYGPGAELWQEAGIQGWYFAHRDEGVLETIKEMASLPNEAQPGEKYVYGYNTDILGAVIEVVSGQSLSTFLKERILDPLDMKDTHFYLPPEKSERLATVYSSSDNGVIEAPDPGHMVGQGAYLNGPRKSYSGGAGLLSTARDYSRFLQMMLNGGTLNGHRLLSPKTVELMTTSHLGEISFPWTAGVGFGLGFSVLEDLGERGAPGSVGEYGWGGAYHSTYWVDPEEELVVTYFTQLIPAEGVDDHLKLRTLIYQAILE